MSTDICWKILAGLGNDIVSPAFSSRLATSPLPALAMKMGFRTCILRCSLARISALEVRLTITMITFPLKNVSHVLDEFVRRLKGQIERLA